MSTFTNPRGFARYPNLDPSAKSKEKEDATWEELDMENDDTPRRPEHSKKTLPSDKV